MKRSTWLLAGLALPLLGLWLLAALADFTGPAWEQEDDITLVTLQRVAQR